LCVLFGKFKFCYSTLTFILYFRRYNLIILCRYEQTRMMKLIFHHQLILYSFKIIKLFFYHLNPVGSTYISYDGLCRNIRILKYLHNIWKCIILVNGSMISLSVARNMLIWVLCLYYYYIHLEEFIITPRAVYQS